MLVPGVAAMREETMAIAQACARCAVGALARFIASRKSRVMANNACQDSRQVSEPLRDPPLHRRVGASLERRHVLDQPAIDDDPAAPRMPRSEGELVRAA